MRGTIEQVWDNESKNGQKYLTVQIAGERYSVWDQNLFDYLKEGEEIDYDFRQNGRFKNLTDVTLPQGTSEPNSMPEYTPTGRDKQIARLSLIKSASALIAPTGLDPEEKRDMVVDTARYFERYVIDNDLADPNEQA